MVETQRAQKAEPAVQAGYMKNLLASLDSLGHLEAMAAHDASLADEVAGASQLAWLPVDLNVRAVDAVAAALGDERGLDTLADCVHAQFDTPLWRNFVGGAVRLLGRDPGSLGRWIPRALQLVFRSCGLWTVDATSDHSLALTGKSVPAELVRHPLWLRSVAIGMKPLFLITGCDGSSRLAQTRIAEGLAVIEIEWKAQA